MKKGIVTGILRRYFIDAMGAMALGLFASLIIGLIISQLSAVPGLSFLSKYTEVLSADSPVVGAAIGAAVAWGLKAKPLVIFSAVAAGAFGYSVGGPVGAYIGGVVGSEFGSLIAGRTKLDIVLVPFVVIVAGGIASGLTGPYIQSFMVGIGSTINMATELSPIPMGIIVAVIVGMCLTAPISSAAICIMLDISGIAAGAAAVGCSTQMVGFAVMTFRENGFGGLISQGLGTSMLQFANIVRRPHIWLPTILASAILGPISTALLGMTNTATGAGMGTAGLVGQFGAVAAMSGTAPMGLIIGEIFFMHFVLPAVLVMTFSLPMRKLGWIKPVDVTLPRAGDNG
ncbi:MAG: PTS sugar transporter subunit IIC [Bacillota bacterium]|nr:PTS sugar transporter subunit IIC [Bacillota bacterium]